MKNEIKDTLKGSDDSKDQTKETNNVEKFADSSYRLALQMRMKHVKSSSIIFSFVIFKTHEHITQVHIIFFFITFKTHKHFIF